MPGGLGKRRKVKAKRIASVLPGPAFFLIFCFSVFFVSCATLPFRTNETRRKIPEDFFGIAPYNKRITPEDFPFIDELGVVWQRRTCRWSSLEPKPGEWDFSDWDSYVEISKNAGKKLLAILAYDTPWVYEEENARRRISARELPLFLNYVETVARRYRGKIDAYEIWNEPNMMQWYGSDEEFITMTRAAIKTIRSVDPDVTILAGSFWRVPKGFIRKMARAGVFDEAGALSFHPYAVSPKRSVELCDSLTEVLAEENFSGEIWITEVGYPTRGWFPTRVSEEEFPSHIVKTLAPLAARNIRALLWYELFDARNPGEYTRTFNSEEFFGIAYPNLTIKAGYHAFALCGRNLAGKEYRPELPLLKDIPKRTISLCFTGEGNETVLILWNESGSSFPACITLPGSEQRLYDISTRQYMVLGEETEITVTKTPLFFTWKGAAGTGPALERKKN